MRRSATSAAACPRSPTSWRSDSRRARSASTRPIRLTRPPGPSRAPPPSQDGRSSQARLKPILRDIPAYVARPASALVRHHVGRNGRDRNALRPRRWAGFRASTDVCLGKTRSGGVGLILARILTADLGNFGTSQSRQGGALPTKEPRSLRALRPVQREPHEQTSLFVGRERELAEVRAAIDDARAGRGRLVLFTGEAGIGKTRLADESARLATAKGMRVRWGRCWEGGGAPAHWPWIQVIRELVADSDAPSVRSRNLPVEIARILPELSSEAPEPEARVDAEQARFRLFDAVATLLREAAREQPIVIVLDDLHEADTASLEMLQFTARVLHDANVLIVGTYREAEMRRSPERSPLMDHIVRDALLLPIVGLTEREVGDLVAGRAAGAPATGIVAELHRATAGNPLFVDGVLRALAAEGRLGEWRAIDLAGFKLPDSVRGAIRRRLGLLSPDARARPRRRLR